MQALVSRGFVAIRGLIGDTFTIAGWRSEGSSYAPDAAVEPLRVSLSPDATLIYDPNRNLSALLQGADPFAFISPDVASTTAW